jgi:hypothetical protein
MPPSIVVRRATASSRTRKVPEKQATQDTTPNDLAEQLASGLRITDNSKGKQKATPRTAESRRATAMRIVNAALKALSCVAESGWKASAAKGKGRKDVTLEKVKSSCAGAIGALRELREMCAADLDVERAATSACAKLVALETVSAPAFLHLFTERHSPVRPCHRRIERHAARSCNFVRLDV